MINVYICTYNPNHEFLRRTIDSLLSQNFDSKKWSLKIVDNNSKSPVSEMDCVKSNAIEVMVETQQGLTAARACAVRDSDGDILVFVDDDNILDKDYLLNVEEAFRIPELGIVSGTILPEYHKNPDDWFYAFEEMIAIRRFEKGEKVIFASSHIYSNLFPIGAGLSIRKKLIFDYYNSHLNASNYIEGRKGTDLSSGEDMDLDYYALSNSYKIGIFPKLKMTHIIPENRVTVEYISRLIKSSLKSTLELNEKWRGVFNSNVFDGLELTVNQIRIRLLVNRLAGLVSKSKYLRSIFLSELLKIRVNSQKDKLLMA